jgi:hypothetical protein
VRNLQLLYVAHREGEPGNSTVVLSISRKWLPKLHHFMATGSGADEKMTTLMRAASQYMCAPGWNVWESNKKEITTPQLEAILQHFNDVYMPTTYPDESAKKKGKGRVFAAIVMPHTPSNSLFMWAGGVHGVKGGKALRLGIYVNLRDTPEATPFPPDAETEKTGNGGKFEGNEQGKRRHPCAELHAVDSLADELGPWGLNAQSIPLNRRHMFDVDAPPPSAEEILATLDLDAANKAVYSLNNQGFVVIPDFLPAEAHALVLDGLLTSSKAYLAGTSRPGVLPEVSDYVSKLSVNEMLAQLYTSPDLTVLQRVTEVLQLLEQNNAEDTTPTAASTSAPKRKRQRATPFTAKFSNGEPMLPFIQTAVKHITEPAYAALQNCGLEKAANEKKKSVRYDPSTYDKWKGVFEHLRYFSKEGGTMFEWHQPKPRQSQGLIGLVTKSSGMIDMYGCPVFAQQIPQSQFLMLQYISGRSRVYLGKERITLRGPGSHDLQLHTDENMMNIHFRKRQKTHAELVARLPSQNPAKQDAQVVGYTEPNIQLQNADSISTSPEVA